MVKLRDVFHYCMLFVFPYINIMFCRSNSKEDNADYGREGAQDFSHQESSTGL